MTKTQRRNSYAATCAACGERIDPYLGVLTGKVDGKWQAEHDRCPAAVEAERIANEAAAKAAYARALAEIEAAHLDEVGLFELRVLKATEHNHFVRAYQIIVAESSTLDQCNTRINAASQGMTMDYMTEFSRESAAIKLAREAAAIKFPAPTDPSFRDSDESVADCLREREEW